MKTTNTVIPPASPARPAASAPPQISIETMKPIRPSRISARRPRRSARCAQTGAIATQSKADRLNATATQRSATWRSRPIAGSSDCIAVLPAAATSITEKSKANRSRESPKPFIPAALFRSPAPAPQRGAAACGLPSAPRFANARSFPKELETSCRHPGTKYGETAGSRAARAAARSGTSSRASSSTP